MVIALSIFKRSSLAVLSMDENIAKQFNDIGF